MAGPRLDALTLKADSNGRLSACALEGYGSYGPRMVAHRLLAALLTQRGTIVSDPEAGCDFLAALRQARMPADVSVAFEFALGTILRQEANVAAEVGDDSGSRLQDARLLAFDLGQGEAMLRFEVMTEAGERATVSAPLQLS